MRKAGFWMGWLAAPAALAGGNAWAQDAAYAVVPVAERLTVGRVFGDAAVEVQLVFVILAVSVLASLAIWAMSLPKVGQADAKGLAGALGRLRIVRSAASPLGLLAASYTLFSVRPAPTITVMAPGWAEAALAVMLGLLATTVAVACERHLEGRIRRAAA